MTKTYQPEYIRIGEITYVKAEDYDYLEELYKKLEQENKELRESLKDWEANGYKWW